MACNMQMITNEATYHTYSKVNLIAWYKNTQSMTFTLIAWYKNTQCMASRIRSLPRNENEKFDTPPLT